MSMDKKKWRRELDKMIDEVIFGGAQTSTTSTASTETQPSLSYEGLLYQMAVWQQDLEEEPIAVAMRAEPGTIALFERYLPKHQSTDVLGALGGIRIEEDLTLPPRRFDFVDYRGRVIQRFEIE